MKALAEIIFPPKMSKIAIFWNNKKTGPYKDIINKFMPLKSAQKILRLKKTGHG